MAMRSFRLRIILLAAWQLFLSGGPAFSAEENSHKYYRRIEPTFKNLAYAEKSPAETFDLYLPAHGKSPAPLVIWIHGGAFRVGDKLSMRYQYFGPPPAKSPGSNGPYQRPWLRWFQFSDARRASTCRSQGSMEDARRLC
jgi:hypothetical protein